MGCVTWTNPLPLWSLSIFICKGWPLRAVLRIKGDDVDDSAPHMCSVCGLVTSLLTGPQPSSPLTLSTTLKGQHLQMKILQDKRGKGFVQVTGQLSLKAGSCWAHSFPAALCLPRVPVMSAAVTCPCVHPGFIQQIHILLLLEPGDES